MRINNCRSARAQMMPFIGGELQVEDAQKMTAHLADCADCAAYAAQLEATTGAIDDALRSEARAPLTLDARVMATIRRTPARGLAWPKFAPPWARARQMRLVVGIASALLVGFIGGNLMRAPQSSASTSMTAVLPPDDLAASYRLMKHGVMTEGTLETKVASQLRALAPAGADKNIELVALHNSEARLVGGCWMNIGGHFVPSFCYQWHDKRVSVFQTPSAPNTTIQSGMLSVQRDEVATVTWEEGDRTFALVAESAPEESLQLARQVEKI